MSLLAHLFGTGVFNSPAVQMTDFGFPASLASVSPLVCTAAKEGTLLALKTCLESLAPLIPSVSVWALRMLLYLSNNAVE